MVHQSDFCQYVKPRMKAYLSERDESLRWLAKQSDVDYHKLYAIENDERKSLPYNDALKLLEVIEPKAALDTLGHYYPAESARMNPKSIGSVSDHSEQDRLLDFALENETRWNIMIEARKQKVSVADIGTMFGTRGLVRLQELLEFGALSEQDGELVSNLNSEHAPREAALKAESRILTGQLNFDGSGTYITNRWPRFNALGKTRVYAAFSDFAEILAEIEKDPELAGSELYPYSLAVGTVSNGGAKK